MMNEHHRSCKGEEESRMKWEDVCQAFPNRWVLIEAVDAYTNKV
ncbi:hypothetical protein P4499_14810 [Geobacillus kaustophilus]|nr:hypothetical protein [Geobacillus kaustophilus]